MAEGETKHGVTPSKTLHNDGVEVCRPFAAGLGDHKIVTTLCPEGKERMRGD